jgi:hypothetical protein
MNKKNASSTLYFIFFFIIFLAFCAFAVDGAIVLTNRSKLQNITEMTAMAAASEFNSDKTNHLNIASPAEVSEVDRIAQAVFKILKNDSLQTAKMDTPVGYIDKNNHTVTITAHMVSQPFFLSFLGVTGINLDAKAVAVSESLKVKASYGGKINWLTKKMPYGTDIIPNDSAILTPLGVGLKSASYSSGSVNYDLISSDVNDPLSLGPGGFITIKLPVPIVDKEGYDLYIKESGALEGYMVFAGLDKDPDQPYVDHTSPNGGLNWVNISCTGDPESTDSNNVIGAYNAPTNNLGNQTKFYGSGYFDISKKCDSTDGYNGHTSMIKYIRIVDDNSETAFIQSGTGYYQTMLYGEASSATAGADIDSVQVLNYVHLQ